MEFNNRYFKNILTLTWLLLSLICKCHTCEEVPYARILYTKLRGIEIE